MATILGSATKAVGIIVNMLAKAVFGKQTSLFSTCWLNKLPSTLTICLRGSFFWFQHVCWKVFLGFRMFWKVFRKSFYQKYRYISYLYDTCTVKTVTTAAPLAVYTASNMATCKQDQFFMVVCFSFVHSFLWFLKAPDTFHGSTFWGHSYSTKNSMLTRWFWNFPLKFGYLQTLSGSAYFAWRLVWSDAGLPSRRSVVWDCHQKVFLYGTLVLGIT